MKAIRDALDKAAPLFEKGGKYERLYPLFEAGDTFTRTPPDVTKGSPHVRDSIDQKRLMVYVIYALTPCIFVIIGSSLNLASVVDLSDSMIFLMALFNIVGVYLLISKVKEELIDYKRIKSSE